MSVSSAAVTRMINKPGSVATPACLSRFHMLHLGHHIGAMKAHEHTGDPRTRVNRPGGSKETTVGVPGCSHSVQQQRVRQVIHKPEPYISFNTIFIHRNNPEYFEFSLNGCFRIVSLGLHPSPVKHRLLLIRVVANAGGFMCRVGGRNPPWKGHRSVTGHKHYSLAHATVAAYLFPTSNKLGKINFRNFFYRFFSPGLWGWKPVPPGACWLFTCSAFLSLICSQQQTGASLIHTGQSQMPGNSGTVVE